MSLLSRKVKMFRCYRDPSIPPRAQNAFMMGDGAGQTQGEAELTEYGVNVKIKVTDLQKGAYYRDFLIPFANLENVEFTLDEVKGAKKKVSA